MKHMYHTLVGYSIVVILLITPYLGGLGLLKINETQYPGDLTDKEKDDFLVIQTSIASIFLAIVLGVLL